MSNPTNNKRLNAIYNRAPKFRSYMSALSWATRDGTSGKNQWIVLGEPGVYLVVRPVDAARLERAGFEMA